MISYVLLLKMIAYLQQGTRLRTLYLHFTIRPHGVVLS